MRIPDAAYVGHRWNAVLATVPMVGCVIWGVDHTLAVVGAFQGHGSDFALIWLISFALLWWIPVSWFEKPITANARQLRYLDSLVVVVQVPVYNEDEDALKNCLQSVFEQSRRVDRIRVVDDGSINKTTGELITYEPVKAWFFAEAQRRGVQATWDRTVNRGKRWAQMHVLANDPGDIFVTLDSDSVLDREAVAEGLKPFKDSKVKSVAGMVVVLNSRTNLLTAALCTLYTPFTRGFRSAQSVLKRVMVNSGTLAFYRGEVVRKYAGVYENEEFLGRPMQMNDDSMLTMYAMLDGDTVHQPSSIVFTLVPTAWKHYRNQTMRWMRGTFVRTLWWFKYMPLTGAGFWVPFVEILQLILSIEVPIALLLNDQARAHLKDLGWSVLVVAVVMNYVISLRFFTIKRSDESIWWHLLLFALAPLTGLWRTLILRPMHIYAMLTCWKVQKWGTREVVEVGMNLIEDAAPTVKLPTVEAV
jgi:hyaluronan synthase